MDLVARVAPVTKGSEVDPSTYYLRAWLNRTLAVGYAMRLATAVICDAYAIR
jgi:hypothetical protein